jgi:hypothetical protein
MSRSVCGQVAIRSAPLLAMALWMGCGSGAPQLVFGPSVTGNQPPVLQILEPVASLARNQGERLSIRWSDSDPDSAALISFFLVNVDTGLEIPVVTAIQENDTAAADAIGISTALVPLGAYNLRGDIADGVNPTVSVFATVEGTTNTRVVIQIGEPGTNPLSVPPQIAVSEPSFNLGVAQDDTLTVVVRPTPDPTDVTTPYDPDSDAQIFILLDLDEDPENDSPLIPNPDQIILLRQVSVVQGDVSPQTFTIPVDLAVIPPRTDGQPYFVRATIVDVGNPAVHAYASGSISILRSATGVVDLSQVGTTLSGARWQGFNPGSRLGSTMKGITDFDADGVDDFILVAQFGNPRNFGNIGEAYLVYGLPQARFGGTNNVNSVSTTIPGVIFEGTPNRLESLHADPLATPRGITSAGHIPDITGDGRPEILFGSGLIDGMYQGRDDDPGDTPGTRAVEINFLQDTVTRNLNGAPDDTLNDEYDGVIDTFISRLQPNQAQGAATSLNLSATTSVDDENPADEFVLVSFTNILFAFTTLNTDDISDLTATLDLTVAPGSSLPGTSLFTANQLTNLNLNDNVTYNDFGFDGEPGPTADAEYENTDLEVSINFLEGTFQIDVTETIQALIDGELGTQPGWILVPAEAVSSSFLSSESGTDFRPRLTITYQEDLNDATNFGCYPDSVVNNASNGADDPGDGLNVDATFEACGAMFMLLSENRDSDPSITDATRLESTQIALELVGQENVGGFLGPTDSQAVPGDNDFDSQIGGAIRHLASADGVPTRGIRIAAGWWEYVNGGSFGTAGPRTGYFGEHVTFLPDINNDNVPEFMVSSPRNELYLSELNPFGSNLADVTIDRSSTYRASITVIPGGNYTLDSTYIDGDGNMGIPGREDFGEGSCTAPDSRDGPFRPSSGFSIFAEDPTDYLGYAESAGDINLDGVPDIVCGAPLNDLTGGLNDTGALYILYGRRPEGNFSLSNLDDPILRPPALRIRGEIRGDKIGAVQSSGLDINGDRVDDIFFGSGSVDFGGVSAGLCGDVDGNGVRDGNDLDLSLFNVCQGNFGEEVFMDDQIGNSSCKAFDFDNDRDIDNDDRNVFDCLVAGFGNCCPVDNGFVGVVFGDINLDGDRTLSQLATNDLPGVKFFGSSAGDRAGEDVVSAGDFNRDGFGDLLIAAPGVRFTDVNGRDRMGVAYLVFGGTHLDGNRTFSLDQVGTPDLPGIIFQTPFFAGRPNEAPIDHVGFLGDINGDGFDDIGLGITRADFLDSALPQNPNDPGTNPNIGRRPDDGNVYIVYGNNTGSNQ